MSEEIILSKKLWIQTKTPLNSVRFKANLGSQTCTRKKWAVKWAVKAGQGCPEGFACGMDICYERKRGVKKALFILTSWKYGHILTDL